MKKTLISIATAASMTMSLNAVEVYNNDNTQVDIYGSVRGLTGYGTYRSSNTTVPEGNTMFSLQGNSRIGVNANIGGLFTTVELGVNDYKISNTITAGFRQLYAGYNFGENYGKLLVGKTMSIAGTDFSSDIFFIDSGLVGFGNGSQGERRFQVQYISPIGLSFAVMESGFDKQATAGNGIDKTSKSPTIPVFALSYDFVGLDNNLIAKIAASYTLINAKTDTSNSNGNNNTNNHRVPIHAYAINAAATYKTLNKSLYFTGIASYSVDAHLYSDAITPKFNGINNVTEEYMQKTEIRQNKQTMVKLYSAALEVGYNIMDNLKAILGGGYQYSIKQSLINDVDFSFFRNNIFHSYGVFAQTRYEVNKFLVFIPSIGYYSIKKAAQNNGPQATINENPEIKYNQLLTGVQTLINF